jgi:flagellar biosynthesis protein
MEPSATSPRLRVVALRHERESRGAPTIAATARGAIAQRILELARAHDVPVREDPDLVELLAACELGQEIPVELYQAVAELLAYLYRLHGERMPAA